MKLCLKLLAKKLEQKQTLLSVLLCPLLLSGGHFHDAGGADETRLVAQIFSLVMFHFLLLALEVLERYHDGDLLALPLVYDSF